MENHHYALARSLVESYSEMAIFIIDNQVLCLTYLYLKNLRESYSLLWLKNNVGNKYFYKSIIYRLNQSNSNQKKCSWEATWRHLQHTIILNTRCNDNRNVRAISLLVKVAVLTQSTVRRHSDRYLHTGANVNWLVRVCVVGIDW